MTARDFLIILLVVVVLFHFLHHNFYISGPLGILLLVLLVLALAGKL
jgi:hypothetical protein